MNALHRPAIVTSALTAILGRRAYGMKSLRERQRVDNATIVKRTRAGMSLLALLASAPRQLPAQLNSEGLKHMLTVDAELKRISRKGELWPGYRPDTLRIVYEVPGYGVLLVNWKTALPEGFTAVKGQMAGWRDASSGGQAAVLLSIEGEGAAYAGIPRWNSADLLGTAAHEAFHFYQRSLIQPGRRFGRGEPPALIAQYPIFDDTNEALVTLEGRALRAALASKRPADARGNARRFAALRATRRARMLPALRDYEERAELNEGLARFIELRALERLALIRPAERKSADSVRAIKQAPLDSLFSIQSESVRRRFYITGAAIAQLIDRTAPIGWERQLRSSDITLDDALASALDRRQPRAAQTLSPHPSFQLPGQLLTQVRSSMEAHAMGHEATADSIARSQLRTTRVTITTLQMNTDTIVVCGLNPNQVFGVDRHRSLLLGSVTICSGGRQTARLEGPVTLDRSRQEISLPVDTSTALSLETHGACDVGQNRPTVKSRWLTLLSCDIIARKASTGILLYIGHQ